MGNYAWTDTGIWEMGDTPQKLCITVQPADIGAQLSTSKFPLGKVIDIQDADKSSGLVAAGFHIKDQVDGKDNKILDSKTIQMCPKNSKSGFGLRFREIYMDNTGETLDFPKISTATHDYKLRPRMKKI